MPLPRDVHRARRLCARVVEASIASPRQTGKTQETVEAAKRVNGILMVHSREEARRLRDQGHRGVSFRSIEEPSETWLGGRAPVLFDPYVVYLVAQSALRALAYYQCVVEQGRHENRELEAKIARQKEELRRLHRAQTRLRYRLTETEDAALALAEIIRRRDA